MPGRLHSNPRSMDRYKVTGMTMDAYEGNAESEVSTGIEAMILIEPSTAQSLLGGISPDDEARVAAYVARASAASTARAYRSDWRLFTVWCLGRGYQSLPATPELPRPISQKSPTSAQRFPTAGRCRRRRSSAGLPRSYSSIARPGLSRPPLRPALLPSPP